MVKPNRVIDEGVPYEIEPKVNIVVDKVENKLIAPTVNIPTLNIIPTPMTPSVNFSVPNVETVEFVKRELHSITPNVFNPPALNEVSIGFAQDMNSVNFYLEPNVIINNASGSAAPDGTIIEINDKGFNTTGFSFEGKHRTTESSGTIVGNWEWTQINPDPSAMPTGNTYTTTRTYVPTASNSYIGTIPSSPQTVFSYTQYQQNGAGLNYGLNTEAKIDGNWIFKNMTERPKERGKAPRNTVRFISLNGTHVLSFYDPTVINFNGNIDVYGRSLIDSIDNNKPHMTVFAEIQAASAKHDIFRNNGVINLKKESAKPVVNANDDKLGRYLIGLAPMIEDYAQYQPVGNHVGGYSGKDYPYITYKPWASETINNGTINVESVDSIGIDFSEFNFHPTAEIGTNTIKKESWKNKGSLNQYVKIGNINVSSTDPENTAEIRGSYGLRVPNLFAPGLYATGANRNDDTNAIYYDETIIDGINGKIALTGNHNIGISISKVIGGSGFETDTYKETKQVNSTVSNILVGTGHMSVYNYQTGKGSNASGANNAGAAGTMHGIKVADVKVLDNTERTIDDPIGNIYNLNILVGGTENVGFLRKSDYMKGNYSATALARARKDFEIRNTHIRDIDFTSTANGSVLFRTDRYGINLIRDLTINPGNANVADKKYNIAMLSNGSENPNDSVKPSVKNTGNITFSAGGQNVIGLMAYNGGQAEVGGNLKITNSDSSIGLAISGKNTTGTSTAKSSKDITVKGIGSVGVYNNAGNYEMSTGVIDVSGDNTIGVYATTTGTSHATTILKGTIKVEGKDSVALYGKDGSEIELDGATINIGNGSLLFYGDGTSSDPSQLKLTGNNSNAVIDSGGTAFYVKNVTGSPLASIRETSSTKDLVVNLQNGSTLIVAEGNGGNTGGEAVSNLGSTLGGTTTGIIINGTAGQYIPYKASRVHLKVDEDSNLDSIADTYLNAEFSSSSITLEAGKTISGSGAITSPIKLAKKSKAAIAQKNITTGVGREDVILTNNGTINLSGSEMVGIVGEYAQIDNRNTIRTTGNKSVGIITSNGGITTNDTIGKIIVGDSGVGIAGINYLGVTEATKSQPTTGKGYIEIVHNGEITSNGTNSGAIGILAQDSLKGADGNNITTNKNSTITLGTGSKIDVSSASGAIGVYFKGSYKPSYGSSFDSIIDNGSDIKIGQSGIGLYSEGADIIANTGTILSTDNNSPAKGIYSDSDVDNRKNITLLGDKSVGIHNYDLNSFYPTAKSRDYVKIINRGKIILGNSASISDPSLGIYTKNAQVEHFGEILGGKNIVGIYSDTDKKVNLANGAKITLSDGAIGIYKKQGTLNLEADSVLTLESNKAVAVYGDNNITITNASKNINIGSKSYGFVILNNGTNSYTSTSTSKFNMESDSIYLYKKGLGLVTSETAVNATGGANTVFFGEEGANIKNTGVLNLQNGNKNTAFYVNSNSKITSNTGNINLQGGTSQTAFFINKNSEVNNTATINLENTKQSAAFFGKDNVIINNSGAINLQNGNNNVAFSADKSEIGNSGNINLQNGKSQVAFYIENNAKVSNTGTLDFLNAEKSTAFYINNNSKAKNNGNINFNSSTNKITGNTALYADNGSIIENTATINLQNGKGNIGGYAVNNSKIYNKAGASIDVSSSDIKNEKYSIGMAAQRGGEVYNEAGAKITVNGNYGIGMFAEGTNSIAKNYGTIELKSSGELKNAYGLVLTKGAIGENHGTIISGSYSEDKNKEGLVGVLVTEGATLINQAGATIDIDARNSMGVYIKNGIIKNYGTIKIRGDKSFGIRNNNGKADPGVLLTETNAGNITASDGASKFKDFKDKDVSVGSTNITTVDGVHIVTIDGKKIEPEIIKNIPENKNYAFSNVGIYIDTLGKTKPIEFLDGFDPGLNNDLIIGTEITELSNAKAIKIGKDILEPYVTPYKSMIGATRTILNVISGSLTWAVKPLSGIDDYPEEAIIAKLPYTDFVSKTENAWNFTDGLEQRYDMNALNSREKMIFNKLNGIGKNEQVLLTQAFDEMMGHQYANVQQRIHSTGQILDKEFEYLKDEWRTASKDSNKIKVFGMKGEYSTDTAGIIDYKSNAYGVAYVGENETIKLGNTTGWYTGIVHNKFEFKDIGKSKEEMLQAKLGLFKSIAFDDDNSLNWTISGEGFVGYNKMNRNFLVVDEIFNAKSKYWSYGAALKNELGKTFRLSEDFSLRAYGSLKAEYGRFQKIKEKDGQIRLEIKSNDYVSIKPEIGGELIYKVPLAGRNFLNARLGVAYENELGQVANAKNKARVAYTDADWFGIRGEKEDRRGNVRTDLKVGLDNEAYGITANVGYDTKGKNVRGGLGLRVIF